MQIPVVKRWTGIVKACNAMIVPADMGEPSKVVGTAFKIVDGIKTAPAA